MLNCLTYIAFVYWAVVTVHTILPIDVGVCGADPSRGGLGALLHHTFGGEVDIDASVWRGFPCNGSLLQKMAFILQRPRGLAAHIMSGGGQDEPFVPILFLVPIIFCALTVLRAAGLRLVSETACRTFLKLGVAVGCRGVIILHSLAYPSKQSLYFKRYSKVEFFIVGWTAYIIELPVWHEALVSGGTAATILLMCVLFPGHFAPEVNPWNVALQGIAAAAFGVAHAYYQQRRRARESAARAARIAHPTGKALVASGSTFASDGLCYKAAPEAACNTAPGAAGSAASLATACASEAAVPAAPAAATPPSVTAVRRIQAMRCRPYVSPARPCRVAIKIQSAHLSDLPPDLLNMVNTRVLAGSGWQAIGAYAREGCIELVLDLRPLAPSRAPFTDAEADTLSDDSRAVSDQDQDPRAALLAQPDGGPVGNQADAGAAGMGDPSLLALGRTLVSCLHSAGLIRPDREPSVVLQLGDGAAVMTWQQEQQAWVPVEGAAAAAAAAAVPSLVAVSPPVTLWPGPGAPLRLHALLRGPSAEELQEGGGLVVRSRSRPLPYSILTVTTAADARPASTAATRQPPLLEVEMEVYGAPASGLLRLEARSASGLLSSPLPVVVVREREVVSGLAALTAALDEESARALLLDFGTWLDVASAVAAGAAREGSGSGAAAANHTKATAPGMGGGGIMSRSSSGAALSAFAGVTADLPCDAAMPYLDLTEESQQRDQACSSTAGIALQPATAVAGQPMLAIAADILTAVCQHGGAAPAVAAVADRLITMVLAVATDTSPAAALASLLDAVPAPPTHAGALHLAIASGARAVAEVLLRWHQRLLAGSGAAKTAEASNPWAAKAACGVTPLHVAAALPDGGALAAWAVRRYPSAAAAWHAVLSADGLTPAALAARAGGRWRLRLWDANPVVLAATHMLAMPGPFRRAMELQWSFRNLCRERRYTAAMGAQGMVTLAIYAAANAVLPLSSLAKAALGDNSIVTFAALTCKVPDVALWLARLAGRVAANGMVAVPPPTPRSATTNAGGGLRGTLLVMHLFRAVAKAAIGLSLWPAAVPRGAALFLSRGGDIALEAVARPLLEQVGLPVRLLVSLLDAPAQLLLYRGFEAQQPGTFPCPLQRLVLYQVVLLATTAAVAVSNRVRFLRAEQGRSAWPEAASAAAAGAEAMQCPVGAGGSAGKVVSPSPSPRFEGPGSPFVGSASSSSVPVAAVLAARSRA